MISVYICNKAPTISRARMLNIWSPAVATVFGRLMRAFSVSLMRIAHSLDAFSAYSNESSRVLNNV